MTLIIIVLSLAIHTAFADRYTDIVGTEPTAFILVLHHFMLIAAGYGAVQAGRVSDALAYMLGIGFVLHHLVTQVSLYIDLYGTGDVLGMATVVMAYLILPGGYMLAPIFYGGGRAILYRRVRRARRAMGYS